MSERVKERPKGLRQRRLGWMRSASHHVTWFLGTRFTDLIPLVFVVGAPKTGTTWVCQLVADAMQLPFPQFSILPIGFPAVVHGHERVRRRYPRGVYVMRDGRDAITSLYFFLARRLAEGDRPPMSRQMRRFFPGLVNKANVHDNIAAFVQRQMTHPHAARANWGDHVRSFYEVKNPNMVLVKYEEMRLDGERTLARTIRALTGEEPDPERMRATIERFSFEKQAGRRAGQEDRTSFLRKGQVGDWRNHFTREAAEIFDRYCGEWLVRAGYETDRAWVESLPARGPAAASGAGADDRMEPLASETQP